MRTGSVCQQVWQSKSFQLPSHECTLINHVWSRSSLTFFVQLALHVQSGAGFSSPVLVNWSASNFHVSSLLGWITCQNAAVYNPKVKLNPEPGRQGEAIQDTKESRSATQTLRQIKRDCEGHRDRDSPHKTPWERPGQTETATQTKTLNTRLRHAATQTKTAHQRHLKTYQDSARQPHRERQPI